MCSEKTFGYMFLLFNCQKYYPLKRDTKRTQFWKNPWKNPCNNDMVGLPNICLGSTFLHKNEEKPDYNQMYCESFLCVPHLNTRGGNDDNGSRTTHAFLWELSNMRHVSLKFQEKVITALSKIKYLVLTKTKEQMESLYNV